MTPRPARAALRDLRDLRERLALAARLLPALPKLYAHRPGGRYTVADLIEERAFQHPERPFLLYREPDAVGGTERRISYGSFNVAANRVAHWAFERGFGPGDAVALLMGNRPEYLATWAGLAKVGATTALINTNLRGAALAHAIEAADTRALVVGSECRDRLDSLEPGLRAALRVWIDAELQSELAREPDVNPDPALRADVRSGDELFYIYTSGTTGLPKAARFSHLRFVGVGEAAAFALRLGEGDVHYCALPLYHSAGGAMVVATVLAAGATMALRRHFSATQFWDDVRRYRATCFQYIGEFCRYLLAQPLRPDDREHRVRAVIGNGLRADIWEEFQSRFGIERIYEFYGATEGNALIVNFENKPGSVGRFPFRWATNVRLVRYDVERDEHPRDDRGRCIECEPGQVGELVGRLPRRPNDPQGRFEGYTSKEATERKILRDVFEPGDAWFRSGDLLRQDEQGFFYFVDRIGDTYRWKGENVSTQEVAEILHGFPGVAMANVYGVRVEGADGRAGMAAIALEEGRERGGFDGKAFYEFVERSLPSYAAPLFVRLLDAHDVTGTFKLRKVRLQEEGYDAERVRDPLLKRDDQARDYVPLSGSGSG